MTAGNDEEFGEFSGLARKLRRVDFSAETGVKDLLKEKLLAREERRTRRWPAFALLLPAAAAAALFVVFAPRKAMEIPSPAASYSLSDDGYSQSGRCGLGDYLSGERF